MTIPYYICKVSSFLIRRLEKLEQHTTFRDASVRAKVLRSELTFAEAGSIKVILADDELHAEDLLSRQRSPQPNPDED